jgi:hypothetical protein
MAEYPRAPPCPRRERDQSLSHRCLTVPLSGDDGMLNTSWASGHYQFRWMTPPRAKAAPSTLRGTSYKSAVAAYQPKRGQWSSEKLRPVTMKSDSTDRTNKKRRPAKRTAASLSGQSLSRRRYRKDSNSRGDFDVDHDPKVGLSVYPPIAARRKPCRGLRCWPPLNELTVVHGFIGPLAASRTASSGATSPRLSQTPSRSWAQGYPAGRPWLRFTPRPRRMPWRRHCRSRAAVGKA